MFQKCKILRNFVQNFPFLPLFWLFLTQIKAFLPQVKKYRPTEMVGIPTNGRYTDLRGSPGAIIAFLIYSFEALFHKNKINYIWSQKVWNSRGPRRHAQEAR